MLGLTLANYNPTQWVNPCRPVFIRVGTSIHKRIDSYLDKTKRRASKKRSCFFSNEQEQNVKLKACTLQADIRKLTASVLTGFNPFATLCLKPWVAFTTYVPVKSCVLLSLKKIFTVVARRESSMHWDDTIYKRKATKFIEMWEWDRWRLYKTSKTVEQHNREHFPFRRSLAAEQLLEELKEGKLFGYVQCDIEVPESWRTNIANFSPIFWNTFVNKSDIGDLMKNYAE